FLKGERRSHQGSRLSLGFDFTPRQRLTVIFVEHGFRVEAVDLRKPSIHKKKDHVLRFSRVVKPVLQGLGGGKTFADHAGESHHSESAADSAKRFATCNAVLHKLIDECEFV